jgi:toxin ParE1/3/4
VKKHVFHPEAEREYTEAANYYFKINPDLSVRFYDEIERLILEARTQPDRFRMFDPPARRHFSDVFPYLDQPDRVWIVAVMHMKRRPGYWRERVG